ncbi:UNVERIFIED_CONTAM: hypothetical protein GTU68_054981, partial [Idotea baltica]|nr:hypothetical protein [Idotea baltica]
MLTESTNSENSFLEAFKFIDLLKYPVVRKRLLILTLCFTCNLMVYYGITYNTSNVSGNEFLNFFYLAIVELPGDFLAIFVAEIFGRRFSEAGLFFISAITTSVTIFVTSYALWVRITILIICKIFVTASFLVIYIQIPELLPTSHRASGFGFIAIISSIVGILSPYIGYSANIWSQLPYVIITLISALGAIS